MTSKSDFSPFDEHDILRTMDQDARNLIGRAAILKNFQANEIVYDEHEPPSYLYFLMSGQVDLVLISADGKQLILATKSSGEVFGTVGFLDGLGHNASAIVRSAAKILCIRRVDFISCMNRLPSLTWFSLLSAICQENRDLTASLKGVALMAPEFQVAKKILDLCVQKDPRRASAMLDISHEKLSAMTGLTRESVSRNLAVLEKKGLIAKMRGVIHVKNIQCLIDFIENQ